MKRTIIMGAGGRDFHNFLMHFKDNLDYDVVAFTWAQIEGVSMTSFPKELAGYLYGEDIPIYPEEDLEDIILSQNITHVFFCYSDVSHDQVMRTASLVNVSGAHFILPSPIYAIETGVPTVAVTAVRTGCGKSGTTRYIAKFLKERGANPVIIRHPMAYRNLKLQSSERFASYDDLVGCTIEELEEFEPLIDSGFVVWCGVDYRTIIKEARAVDKPSHFIWDGGNNDFEFLYSELKIVVTDPFRWTHTNRYYPGFLNLLTADVAVINKVNTAYKNDVSQLEELIKRENQRAKIVKSSSVVSMTPEELKAIIGTSLRFRRRNVLVIEDGPTTTHGDMPYGIGLLTLRKVFGILETMYVQTESAVGYNKDQLRELEQKINSDEIDYVFSANQIDLTRILNIEKPVYRLDYESKFGLDFDEILEDFVNGVVMI